MTDIPIHLLPADHFDPPAPSVPCLGGSWSHQPADAIVGAL